MIIWRGWGILVLVIAFACSLVANLLANHFSGTKHYWESQAWPLAAALITAGIIIWWIGRLLKRQPPRELLDVATGERVQLRDSHDFFFILMKYWGMILIAIGLTVWFTDAAPGPSKASARRATGHE